MANSVVNSEKMIETLNRIYGEATKGIKVISRPIEEMADCYHKKYNSTAEAIRQMQNNQIKKCTTSGIITGFGGLVVLPVALPANLTSVWYIQIRMIAATAYLAGYDIYSDQVKTMVYMTLAGITITDIAKQAGIKVATKLSRKAIEKIPGKVLTQINKAVGFRLVTKFGQKGIVNLGKLVPAVGAAVGGAMDCVETKIIAKRANKMFLENIKVEAA